MNSESSIQTAPFVKPLPKWRLAFRYLYIVLACLIALSVVIQVFLAGAAVTVHASYWPLHRSFAHTIELLIILACLVGLGTGLPWRIQGLGGLLFLLLALQYIFLETMPRFGLIILRAFHVVDALFFFWVSLALVGKVWQQLRLQKQAELSSELVASES